MFNKNQKGHSLLDCPSLPAQHRSGRLHSATKVFQKRKQMTPKKPTSGKRAVQPTKRAIRQDNDTTERRKKKLTPDEEKHRYVLANMEEGYYELDLNGNFTFANPAMCLSLGRKADDLIGLNYRDCVSVESADKVEETFEKVYRTGIATKIIEFEFVQKDSTRRRHQMSVSLLRSASGEPSGFFGISRDRTDELRLENALRESEASYRGVMDLCPDTISINETETGRYVDVNKTFTRQTGYSAEEAIGRTPAELGLFATPEDQRRLGMALRQGSINGLDLRFRAKNGTLLEDLVSGRRIHFKGKDCFLFVATVITPLKEIQKALRESEESYRRVMELAPDAITITRLSDGKYFEVNETFCQQTGYHRDQVIGSTAMDLDIYADPADRKRLITVLRQQGRVDGMEIVFRARGGRLLYDLVSARIMQFKNEECVLIIATVINDLKEAQKALEESERRYRTILEAAPDAICLTRLSDGKYIEANSTFYQRTGYTPEETIGHTSSELHIYANPTDRGKLIEALQRDSQVDGLEVLVRYKDGSLSYNLWSCRVIEHNGEACLLVVSKEIDELKEAQRALTESERSYRAILNSAPYSITVSRITDGRYVQVNKAFCERTGYSRQEALGHTTLELNLYVDMDDRERMIAALRRDGKVDGMELPYRCKDGTVVEALVSVRAIRFYDEPCLLHISTNIDALKKAQRELRESEESYRAILDSAPYSITISRHSNAQFILVNDAFCRNTGYSRQEVIGRVPRELNLYETPQDRQHFLDTYRRQGWVDGMEIPFRSKDGTITTSLTSARAITFKGEPCMLAITTNIDAQKKIQQALEESEAAYRSILDTAPYTIVVTRLSDSQYVRVNPAYCRRTGYSEQETIGRTAQELNLWENPADRERMLEMLKSKGQVEGMEANFRTKDGRRLESLVSVTPIRYRGEECILSMTVDINALKATQRALRESEENYRRILESAPYSIVITRLSDNRYMQVNGAFCRRTGYSREESAGHTPYDLNIFVDPTARKRMLEVFRRDGKVEGMEIQFRAKDGHILESLFSVTPINFHGDDCLLAMTVDIAERKRVERELEQYRHHLEEMVQARTQALEEAQAELVKREKLAVLGQLTATVSHELRNPLGVIRSSNFFLQRKITDRDEKVDKHFRRIEEQVALCDAIVDDLLEYTRGRSASMVKADLTPWLIQVIEQLQESQRVTITQDLARPLPMTPHDPEKMRRVVINIIDNAIQAVRAKLSATNDGPAHYQPAITVKTSFDHNRVILEIADNGIGMEPETLQRAFEPLFTTRARGTGIGLAIVKKVVNEHGGDVSLESTIGEGTRVLIALPGADPSPVGKG
jgi:PAS domain S-box-containing protein